MRYTDRSVMINVFANVVIVLQFTKHKLFDRDNLTMSNCIILRSTYIVVYTLSVSYVQMTWLYYDDCLIHIEPF